MWAWPRHLGRCAEQFLWQRAVREFPPTACAGSVISLQLAARTGSLHVAVLQMAQCDFPRGLARPGYACRWDADRWRDQQPHSGPVAHAFLAMGHGCCPFVDRHRYDKDAPRSIGSVCKQGTTCKLRVSPATYPLPLLPGSPDCSSSPQDWTCNPFSIPPAPPITTPSPNLCVSLLWSPSHSSYYFLSRP